MLLANAEVDTSQDIPGAWPMEDSYNPHSRGAHPSHEPYNHRRRPHRGRYQPRNRAYCLSRDELREMALSTLGSLDDGFYIYHSHGKDIRVDLKDAIEWISKETSYFGPDWDGEADGERFFPDEEETGQSAVESQEDEGNDSSVAEIDSDVVDSPTRASEPADDESAAANATTESQPTAPASPTDDSLQQDRNLCTSGDTDATPNSEKIVLETDRSTPTTVKTRIVIAEYSTLVGTRKLHHLLQHDEHVKNKTIGVLNFASAKKPGGGFLNGAQAQEESLARVSTLYPALLTPTAQRFYGHWQADPDNAFYTHSIVYSPSIIFFRNDKGDWKAPLIADILTCAAVNAGEVRDRIKWDHEQREMQGRAQEVAQNMWRLAEKRKAEEQSMRGEEMKRLKDIRDEMEAAADALDKSLKMLQDESEKRAGDEPKIADENMDVDEQETQRAVEIGEHILNVEGRREEIQEKMAEIDREITQLAEELNDTHIQTPNAVVGMEKELKKDTDDAIMDEDSNLGTDATCDQEVSQLSDKLSEADNPFASPEDQHGLPPTTEPTELPLPASPSSGMTLDEAEVLIQSEMKERIFRILKVFQKQGAQHLVLGSFGTGVFQNEVDIVAGIFRELLVGPAETGSSSNDADGFSQAPFKDVFSSIVFAILGGGTVRVFENAFEGVAEKDEEVIGGSGDEDEPMGGCDEVPQHSFWGQDPAAATNDHPESTAVPISDSHLSTEEIGHGQVLSS